MRKTSFFGFLFFTVLYYFFILSCQAQDFNNYKALKSSGDIPKKFLTSSTEKYQSEIGKLTTKEKARYRRAKKEYILESSFAIEDLLLSGKVLFNDPVGLYVNKVVDEILKDDPDLRSKVEVYVVKSNEVNAFTMANSGIIIVTLGLIAQVENEAELAWILSHEITHFVKQHALNTVVDVIDMRNGKGNYQGSNTYEKILARSNFSKKQESEADLIGLERFLKSSYDASTLNSVFDVLQYSHLPFDEIPYKKTFLETANLKFPDFYFLKKTKEIEAIGYDDTLATHPSVKLRREAVMEKLKGLDFKGKKKFIVGDKEFFLAQKRCRFEMSTIFLHYRQYEAAYYNTYLLLQDDPNSQYLKKCIGKSLYGLSKYANADRYHEAHQDYKDIQGSSQQVYYLFDKISPGELNAITVAYLYSLKKQYPNDKEIAAITTDIFSELPEYYESKNYFINTPRPTNLDSILKADLLKNKDLNKKEEANESDDANDENSISRKKENKYDRINKVLKKKGNKTDSIPKNDYIKYVFVGMMSDANFMADYDSAVSLFSARKKQTEIEATEVFKNTEAKRLKREKRKGLALGIKQLVLVNPFYYKIDDSKDHPINLIASESAQKDLNNKLRFIAQSAGLNYQLIDRKDLRKSGSDLFNDLAILNYYIGENHAHGELFYVNHMTEDLQALITKYGTRYFNWSGIICRKVPAPPGRVFQILLGGLFPPVGPLLIYNTFRGHYNTFIYSELIDLKTGQTIDNRIHFAKFRDRVDVVNSVFYDVFFQYKKIK